MTVDTTSSWRLQPPQPIAAQLLHGGRKPIMHCDTSLSVLAAGLPTEAETEALDEGAQAEICALAQPSKCYR